MDAESADAPRRGDTDLCHDGGRPYVPHAGQGLEEIQDLEAAHGVVAVGILDHFRHRKLTGLQPGLDVGPNRARCRRLLPRPCSFDIRQWLQTHWCSLRLTAPDGAAAARRIDGVDGSGPEPNLP